MFESKETAFKKHFALGKEAINKKEYKAAIEEFKKASDMNVDNNAALFNLADAYYQAKNYETAITHWTAYIKSCPTVAIAFHNRALCFIKLRNFTQAINDLDTAIKLDFQHGTTVSDLAASYNERGLCYLKLDQLDKALKDLDQAIGLSHENGFAYHYRIDCYIKVGEYKKAYDDYLVIQNRFPERIEANPNFYKKISQYFSEEEISPNRKKNL